MSPDEESPNNTPKSTRDRNRLTNNEQTPLSKQSGPMYIPKVPLIECASQDDNYITTSDIPEAPRSCFTTGISNDDSLLDISVINNNDNNINKDSQSVTIIIHRRRSRSADTTGSCDGDHFPMEMRNNHPKNVDSILKHILTVDPVVCDVTKSSSSVKQSSEVPNQFEYAKSNTCWPITSIMNADNKGDLFIDCCYAITIYGFLVFSSTLIFFHAIHQAQNPVHSTLSHTLCMIASETTRLPELE